MHRDRGNTVWDLRAHRSVMPDEVRQAVIRNEVGNGYDNLRAASPEAYLAKIEEGCTRVANRCFASRVPGGLFVNPHPVSGSIANLAALTALVNPGEYIASLGARSISHFSLGSPTSLTSRLYNILPLEPQRNNTEIDFEKLWSDQKQRDLPTPRLIAFGPTAYPCHIKWQGLRNLADRFNPPPLILIDVSHYAGPIAADLMESPCHVADVVTFTTYKSLCGPANAVILSRTKELHDSIRSALIPGLQDVGYLSSIEAIAASLRYATTSAFKEMQRRASSMASTLSQILAKNGVCLAFGGTHTHLLVVDLAPRSVKAVEMLSLLADHGILCDTAVLPGDDPDRPTGLRFGTIELAQKGCTDETFQSLAVKLTGILCGKGRSEPLSVPYCPISKKSGNPCSTIPCPNTIDRPVPLPTGMVEGRPDDFMFRQFRRHSEVLRTPSRHDYFMLSGGANLFPVSAIWKELLDIEIRSDLAYGWYTSQEGAPTLRRTVSMWENYAASRGGFPERKPLGSNVCMTLGASQAVAAVFDYIANTQPGKSVLFIGHNYGLFERLAHHYNLPIHEILGENEESTDTLPSAEAVTHAISTTRPAIVVLVTPNNPTGEQYRSDEIKNILIRAANTGAIILFDEVGQMLMAQDSWINIGEIVASTGTQAHVALINSFSKSDAVPGFRVGYLLAPEAIARHASRYQLMSMMNPPTVPILPVFFSLLSRCIYTSENLGWSTADDRENLLSFALHMFEVTAAISPSGLIKDLTKRLSREGFDQDHKLYVEWHKTVGQAIRQNHAYTLERLSKHVTRATGLKGGFNCFIELEPLMDKDEDEVCCALFEKTSVAILTESCFRVSRRRRKNFWVRISLAAPVPSFQSAIDRFGTFLDTI